MTGHCRDPSADGEQMTHLHYVTRLHLNKSGLPVYGVATCLHFRYNRQVTDGRRTGDEQANDTNERSK